MRNDFLFFLLTLVLSWIVMMAITFGNLLCRTTFGGVWSSIVIDDCTGSYWTPTIGDSAYDEGDWYPLAATAVPANLRSGS